MLFNAQYFLYQLKCFKFKVCEQVKNVQIRGRYDQITLFILCRCNIMYCTSHMRVFRCLTCQRFPRPNALLFCSLSCTHVLDESFANVVSGSLFFLMPDTIRDREKGPREGIQKIKMNRSSLYLSHFIFLKKMKTMPPCREKFCRIWPPRCVTSAPLFVIVIFMKRLFVLKHVFSSFRTVLYCTVSG